MSPETTRRPPPKRAGQSSGPRRFDGALVDVATQARGLGIKEKALRAQVARGMIPHRRLGGRIVFLPSEVAEYLRRLPGVTVDQALENVAARQGEAAR